jgi:hypothetical protein
MAQQTLTSFAPVSRVEHVYEKQVLSQPIVKTVVHHPIQEIHQQQIRRDVYAPPVVQVLPGFQGGLQQPALQSGFIQQAPLMQPMSPITTPQPVAAAPVPKATTTSTGTGGFMSRFRKKKRESPVGYTAPPLVVTQTVPQPIPMRQIIAGQPFQQTYVNEQYQPLGYQSFGAAGEYINVQKYEAGTGAGAGTGSGLSSGMGSSGLGESGLGESGMGSSNLGQSGMGSSNLGQSGLSSSNLGQPGSSQNL